MVLGKSNVSSVKGNVRFYKIKQICFNKLYSMLQYTIQSDTNK